MKDIRNLIRNIRQSCRTRVSAFFLLASLLTITVVMMLPPVQSKIQMKINELTHYRSMNGPEITDVPSDQYDHWGRGQGDCMETRMVIGSFNDTAIMGNFAFQFERLYVVKEIHDSYETDVVAEVKCTHIEGKDSFGKHIPNHKMQFIIAVEKDGVHLMDIYFAYREDAFDGSSFYHATRYDEEEYRYESIHETFPWNVNNAYVHMVDCGYELRNEKTLISRYGDVLFDRYNKREQEKSIATYYTDEEAFPISALDSKSLRKLDASDFIEALRPDRYVISYIALGVNNYKNVRAFYYPDGNMVSTSDTAGLSLIGEEYEYDGYGSEYLYGNYRIGQLYSLCDRSFFTPPDTFETYGTAYCCIDGKLEETVEFAKVFAPFVQLYNRILDETSVILPDHTEIVRK